MRLVSLLSFCLTLPAFAIVNFIGFETGSEAELGGGTGGTYSIVSSPVKNGTYAFRTNPTTSNTGYGTVYGITSAGGADKFSLSVAYVGFWFRYHTKPSSGSEQIFMGSHTSSNLCEVRIDSSGYLSFYASTGGTTLIATGTTVLSADTWYFVEVKYSKGTGAPYEIRINGVSEVAGTCDYPSTNVPTHFAVGKRINRSSQTVDYYFDDIYVNSDYVTNAYTSKILLAKPSENGSTMQWTAGTGGSDYTQVNEIPPSESEYVQSTAGGDVALFGVQNCSTVGISGTIISLKAMTRVASASTSSSYKVRIRSSSTNSDNGAASLGASYLWAMRIADTDPATSSAWTTSGVDAVEIGGVDNSGTDRVRMAFAAASVFFTPPAEGITYYGGAHHR